MLTADQLKSVQSNIKHVIVLMLENRSFDHMLGYSKIEGIEAESRQNGKIEGIDPVNKPSNEDNNGNVIYSTDNADFIIGIPDPGHDFLDVLQQLTDRNNNVFDASSPYPGPLTNAGCVKNYQRLGGKDPGLVMKAFAPEKLPILTQLAKEFVVCDHWFSSMPGPTWPNRFFVHAASSAGLDDSPSLSQILLADTIKGFKFDKGTIFNCLSEHRINWTIYSGNRFPQVLALKGIRANDIIDINHFGEDLTKPGFPAYTFIEPNYGHFLQGHYREGNSQHPLDDVRNGEKLIKDVYELIRKSDVWKQCVLIITYDEHGGFYDHCPPPSAADPGDQKPYSKHHFNFEQLGVRVPSVIISPWIPRNIIDKRVYDHTSILSTLEKLFDMGNLTERDRQANHFLDLFTLDKMRETPETLHDHLPVPPGSDLPESPENIDPNAPLDSSLAGFVHVAFIRDMEVSSPADRAQLPDKLSDLDNRGKALSYMNEIKSKLQA